MALYKVGEGWGVDYRDEFGRRHRKFVGSQQAATIVQNQLKQQAHQQRSALSNFRSAADLSPQDALDIFLANLAQSPNTKASYRDRLTRIIQRLEIPLIADLTPALIDAWSRARAQEVSPRTLAHESANAIDEPGDQPGSWRIGSRLEYAGFLQAGTARMPARPIITEPMQSLSNALAGRGQPIQGRLGNLDL